MRTIFNYCFYRYAKFYKEWGDNGPYIMAFGLLFLTIASIRKLSISAFLMQNIDVAQCPIHNKHPALPLKQKHLLL